VKTIGHGWADTMDVVARDDRAVKSVTVDPNHTESSLETVSEDLLAIH